MLELLSLSHLKGENQSFFKVTILLRSELSSILVKNRLMSVFYICLSCCGCKLIHKQTLQAMTSFFRSTEEGKVFNILMTLFLLLGTTIFLWQLLTLLPYILLS